MQRVLNGLEPFQKGEIVVDGTSVSAAGKSVSKLRAKVGMVFQTFELFPHLSITENLTIAQVKVLGRNPSKAMRYGLQYLDRVGAERVGQQISRAIVGWPAAAGSDCASLGNGTDLHAFR